jgi:hypothetical protein
LDCREFAHQGEAGGQTFEVDVGGMGKIHSMLDCPEASQTSSATMSLHRSVVSPSLRSEAGVYEPAIGFERNAPLAVALSLGGVRLVGEAHDYFLAGTSKAPDWEWQIALEHGTNQK